MLTVCIDNRTFFLGYFGIFGLPYRTLLLPTFREKSSRVAGGGIRAPKRKLSRYLNQYTIYALVYVHDYILAVLEWELPWPR